ncbi:MAG: hypothetical protein KO206_00680 [Methanomicrobiaceae archaeon]|nr:hypothetical protein [Methanomicrobiaceae archaeon]MDD5418498.1 hypothetical protein [Methanomicrobiaceae archaeon]
MMKARFVSIIILLLLGCPLAGPALLPAAAAVLHALPGIPDDAVPHWERDYLQGAGDPVLEVINVGKREVTFSLWKTPPDYYEGYHLTPADYAVTVQKGERASLVVDEGHYLYWAAEMPYETSPWWSGSTIWFDGDCTYTAVFPEESNLNAKSIPGFEVVLPVAALTLLALFWRKTI